MNVDSWVMRDFGRRLCLWPLCQLLLIVAPVYDVAAQGWTESASPNGGHQSITLTGRQFRVVFTGYTIKPNSEWSVSLDDISFEKSALRGDEGSWSIYLICANYKSCVTVTSSGNGTSGMDGSLFLFWYDDASSARAGWCAITAAVNVITPGCGVTSGSAASSPPARATPPATYAPATPHAPAPLPPGVMRQADGSVAPAAGYEWATSDTRSLKVRLKRGLVQSADGKSLTTAPGYEWATADKSDLSVRLKVSQLPLKTRASLGPVLTITWVESLGDNMKYIYVSNESKFAVRLVSFVFDECVNGFPCVDNFNTARTIGVGQADLVMTLIRKNTDAPWRFRYRYLVEAVP